ncbi:MAG: O-phosphoserine--tRNA ligase [Candidatus Hecatellaceae archaeon]
MVVFDTRKIREMAEKDFEKAWLETARLLKLEGRSLEWVKGREGKRHPVMEVASKLREIFLSYGLEEVLNPSIVGEAEIYRQYGPEAPIILDRCFYLAELPRPDLGVDSKTLAKIREAVPSFTEDKAEGLKRIFRAYKEGKIDSGALAEEIVERLDVKPEEATTILSFFPELIRLEPKPTRQVLRSHMTSLWFPVMAALQDKRPLPIKLFSIGPKFRREQRLDSLHLYESYVASVAIMGEDLTLEDGTALTRAVLAELGFKEARFKVKKATSKYYAPGTEMEVFIRFGDEWVEVGDQGLYSPVALANYDIRHPVFNVGFGVERIAMLLTGEADIRKLSYPQFYVEAKFTDAELASMLRLERRPATEEGWNLARALVEAAITHGEALGPCEFKAFEGQIGGCKVKAYVYEKDAGAKLLSPAALNTIYVYKASIIAIPPKGFEENPLVAEARSHGVSTGIRFLDAVAAGFAAEVEAKAQAGEKGEVDHRVRMVKQPSDVNVEIPPQALKYITSKGGRIIVKGPLFLGLKALIG